jgi:lysophospholipase L1-like esterase
MIRSPFLLLFTLAFLRLSAAVIPLELVEPDHPAIRYVGRFTPDAQFQWSGSSISLRFSGSSLNAILQTQNPAGVEVILNGESRFLKLSPDQSRYVLAEGLPADQLHEVTLFRRSEAELGTMQFYGFEVKPGTRLERPPSPGRRMLVVGDSITCAYANETLDTSQGNTAENQNAYQSYAAITARRLGADLHMICWSGRGLYRNRMLKFERHETMPKIFDRILPSQAGNTWNHDLFIPDVVVINLGTNDATDRDGQKTPLEQKDFVSTYRAFLTRIRSLAPDATLFVTLGPMGDHVAPITREWLEEAAAPFEDAHVLLFPGYTDPSEIGGHWHPSVKKHHMMAEELLEAILAVTDWEPGTDAESVPDQK